jgi:hypothetical protein
MADATLSDWGRLGARQPEGADHGYTEAPRLPTLEAPSRFLCIRDTHRQPGVIEAPSATTALAVPSKQSRAAAAKAVRRVSLEKIRIDMPQDLTLSGFAHRRWRLADSPGSTRTTHAASPRWPDPEQQIAISNDE